MTSCAIFIDTNLVLHFKPIDQIDWPAVTGYDECALVIAPILLKELEHQKIFNRGVALRGRAARMIDFLVEKMQLPDPIELRPGTTLHFIDHEPTLDFAENRLVREIQDDHYIASALEYYAGSGVMTFIASNDGGMALKLRARPIRNIRLAASFRLPPEVDAEQRELRDAKLQIARMQAQRPKLLVRFGGGGNRLAIRNSASLADNIPTAAQIRASNPRLPLPEEKPSKPFTGDISSIGGLRGSYGLGSRANVARYNDELEQFYAEYDRYLSDAAAWRERLRLTATIELELFNDGSQTATNVDVTLRFPPSVSFVRSRDFPKQPKRPLPPSTPGTMRPFGAERELPIADLRLYDLHDRDGDVFINNDRNQLRFSCASLKQKCVLKADKVLLTRDPALTDGGIEIQVDITYHEGEPVEQKLAVIFSEVDAADSSD